MILREILHAHIPTLTETSTIRDAVDKMDIYQFPALVVVSPEGEPTHVITEGDIARAIQSKGSLTSLRSNLAKDIGTIEPTTLGPTAEISDALHLMLQSGLTILPIVDEKKLMGVVLRVDLMQALLLDLPKELDHKNI